MREQKTLTIVWVVIGLHAELDTGIAMNLMFGDCLERMKEIPDGSVDMILADPPYGTTACKWDVVIPFEPLWEQYRRVAKRNAAIVLTASQPFTTALIFDHSPLSCSHLRASKNHHLNHLIIALTPIHRHLRV